MTRNGRGGGDAGAAIGVCGARARFNVYGGGGSCTLSGVAGNCARARAEAISTCTAAAGLVCVASVEVQIGIIIRTPGRKIPI